MVKRECDYSELIRDSEPASGSGQLFTDERQGLQARDFKWFTATDVHTRELVISPNHIGLRLGELGAIALVRMTGKLSALSTNHPGDLVVSGLSTLGTDKVVGSCFGGLVEKVAFFHCWNSGY